MRAGIALDAWKVKIFKKILNDAGFEYELLAGMTENTRTMIVETDEVDRLGKVIEKANEKAAKSRAKQK